MHAQQVQVWDKNTEVHRYLQKEEGRESSLFANIFLQCTYFGVYQNPSIHALYRKVQPARQQFVWNQVCVSIFQDCAKVYAYQYTK